MVLPPRVDVDAWNAEQSRRAVESHPTVCLYCRAGGDPETCPIFASVKEVAVRHAAKLEGRR